MLKQYSRGESAVGGAVARKKKLRWVFAVSHSPELPQIDTRSRTLRVQIVPSIFLNWHPFIEASPLICWWYVRKWILKNWCFSEQTVWQIRDRNWKPAILHALLWKEAWKLKGTFSISAAVRLLMGPFINQLSALTGLQWKVYYVTSKQ